MAYLVGGVLEITQQILSGEQAGFHSFGFERPTEFVASALFTFYNMVM